jgi:hypothetical protein
VRQAANVESRTACGIKGRRLSTVSALTHLRIAYARSPGRLSRRALSPSLAKRALLWHQAGSNRFRSYSCHMGCMAVVTDFALCT